MARERDRDQCPQPPARRADGVANAREQTDRDHREPEREESDHGVGVPPMVQQRTERRRRDACVDEIGVRQVGGDDTSDEEGSSHRSRRVGRQRELGERRAHE